MTASETPIDLVVFDLDGTLVQLDFTGEGMKTVRADLRGIFAEVGINQEFRPLLTTLEEALDTLAESTDTDTAERIQQRAFQCIAAMERDAVSRQHVYDTAQPVLERVVASDSTFAVATNNTREAATRSIADAGFPEPDYLVAVDDVFRPKPNPDMITELLDRIDSKPETLAMIGDRQSDAKSALSACKEPGIRLTTVLIERTDTEQQNHDDIDHVVSSLERVVDILYPVGWS
jgi:HAD superfamily hydrolase (TIGR01549 family)